MADDRQDERQVLNPAALAVADAARLLGVPLDVVQKHLAEGAPRAGGGTMNLIHYAAWLNRELARREPTGQSDGD
jgi:hypothetical protein